MDKQEIRAYIKSQFANNDFKYLDQKINEILIDFLSNYQSIALYNAMNDEVNLKATIKHYIGYKNLYVPKITDDSMEFTKINIGNEVQFNKYNIEEVKTNDYVDLSTIEVMIVPLRAFDKNLNRLGRGKGYYDKVLNNIKLKVGVAYSIQEVDLVPTEFHDIKLDMIITEKGIVCI